MKKITMALAVAVILPMMSCGHDEELTANVIRQDTMQTKTIIFTFSDITMQSMTRSTLSEAQMTDLWVFDYVDGVLKNTIHQQSADADFGSPAIDADYGDHDFYFVASRGDSPTVNGTSVTWAKPSDTFWQHAALSIEPQTSTSQPVSLQRVATRLRVTINDQVPATMKKLCLTPTTWYYGIDYATGEAVSSRAVERSVNVPASYVGTSGSLSASFYCLSPSDEWQTDVTIVAKGENDAVLNTITIADVPMKRNRITNYSGTLFNASRTMSVSLTDDWLDDLTGTW